MLRLATTLSVSMVLLLLAPWLTPAEVRGQSTGNTLYVDSGTPGSFESITNAIAAALPGDTVYVASGIYIENVVIGKRIDLVGQDRTTTIIVGDGNDHAIQVTADHASVSNLRVHNITTVSMAGILVSGSHNTITNNDICQTEYGIFLAGAQFATISNNVIQDAADGILFSLSMQCTVSNNYIRNSRNIGIHLKLESSLNTIRFNTVVNSDWRCFCKGIAGTNNSIYNNNFCNPDAETVNDPGTNIYYAPYPTGGNYYDEYTGADLFHGANQDIPGPDGIGDTPYLVHGDNGPVNVDLYPLMDPYGPGVVLDNTAPEFVTGGAWVTGPYPHAKGKTLHGIAGGSGSRFAGWRVDTLVTPGKYDVSLWKFEHPFMALMTSAAQVQVWDKSGPSPWITVDLSAPGTDWIDLGAFEFDASSIQGVLIMDSTNGILLADAISLIPHQDLTAGN